MLPVHLRQKVNPQHSIPTLRLNGRQQPWARPSEREVPSKVVPPHRTLDTDHPVVQHGRISMESGARTETKRVPHAGKLSKDTGYPWQIRNQEPRASDPTSPLGRIHQSIKLQHPYTRSLRGKGHPRPGAKTRQNIAKHRLQGP